MRKTSFALAALAAAAALPAAADDATFTYRALTPETALAAAQTALKSCRDAGYQVAVAVVDRGGNPQVMLRDRFAGAHTPDTAVRKAYTAVSFRTNTTALIDLTGPGKPQAGMRGLPGVAVLGGGIVIESAGNIVGGIGVSGAPGGDLDDKCAEAGIAAIRNALEF